MKMPKVGDRVRLTGKMKNTDSSWMPEESLSVVLMHDHFEVVNDIL